MSIMATTSMELEKKPEELYVDEEKNW